MKVDWRVVTEQDLLDRLKDFEERYQRPSDQLEEAFVIDGELVETDDYHRWQRAWIAYQLHKAADDSV